MLCVFQVPKVEGPGPKTGIFLGGSGQIPAVTVIRESEAWTCKAEGLSGNAEQKGTELELGYELRYEE